MTFHCLILGAGFATRLGDIAKGRPKALLPLGNSTILDQMLLYVRSLPGIAEIALVTNSTFAPQYESWNATQSRPITLISNGVKRWEDMRGANRDAWLAIEQLGWTHSDVLIMGCDNFIEESLAPAAERFLQGTHSLVIAADYGSKERVKRLAVPVIEQDGLISDMVEKPAEPKTTLGVPLVYFIKAQDLHHLEDLAALGKDNIGHLLERLCANKRLAGYVTKSEILDIGLPEDYAKAQARCRT